MIFLILINDFCDEGAAHINYITSRNNVNPAGDLVARFVNNLLSSGHLRAMNTVSCAG